MADLSGLTTNYFATPKEGFTTTLASTISSGATTVPLNSISGYTNGAIITLVVDPTDASKKQTFTGVVDTSGVQVTSVVWTEGTNQSHTTGATVVDYVTATHMAAAVKGIVTEHAQDGTHKAALITSRTEDTSPDIGADYLLTYDTSATALKKVKPTNLGLMTGWIAGQLPSVSSVTNNGQRSYDVTFASSVASYLTPGQRIRTTRTSAAPTQCTSLNGTTQYWSRASGSLTGTLSTFTDDFTVSAWIKLTSYPSSNGGIITRWNGTSGWMFYITNTGQLNAGGWNGGVGNSRIMSSYQSLPLNKWVHVSASLDMSGWTTATNKITFDGVDVPVSLASAGTNPTSWANAGNLEVGSYNGGTNFFPGKIAQVAVFNGNVSTVTQANIRSYMSQGMTGSETNCIFFVNFNNSTTDLSASANTLSAGAGSPTATNADSPFGGQADGTISSTLDYGIVTKVSTTVATVQVPEGCTIPTSGGVTTVDMSAWKAPYGFPDSIDKWTLLYFQGASNPATATGTSWLWSTVGNIQMTLPIGSWDVFPYFSLSMVGIDGYVAFSSSSSTPTDIELTQRWYFNSAVQKIQKTSMSKPITLSAATTYYGIMNPQNATAAGFRGRADDVLDYSYIIVRNAHLQDKAMNGEEISLAAIALAASAVAGIVWLAKYFAKELSVDLREHTKAATELTAASKEQAKASREAKAASNEVLTFMKRLNGTLPRSIEEKQAIKAKESK